MEHNACGCCIVNYRYKEESGCMYYSGSISYPGGSEESCKFFTDTYTSSKMLLYWKVAEISSEIRAPRLLAPKIATCSTSRKHVVMGYKFDKLFEEQPKEALFSVPNGILSGWWRNQIRNIFGTLITMHEKKVYHGDLLNPRSYVMVGEEVHLVNPMVAVPSASLRYQSPAYKDLMDFRSFLQQHTLLAHSSDDWDNFICLFGCPAVSARQLMKHPVLMDASERFDYMDSLVDCCVSQWDVPNVLWSRPGGFVSYMNTQGLTYFTQFVDWNVRIPPRTVYHDIYQKPPAYVRTYDPRKIKDLIGYVGNVLKHSPKSKTTHEIEREIQNMFPGFLSRLHSGVAVFSNRHSSRPFKITEE